MESPLTQAQLLATAAGVVEPLGARLVDFSDDDVSVEAGLGMRKRRVDVPLAALEAWLSAGEGHAKAGVVSFFRGIVAVAVAPRLNRRELSLAFPAVAGRLLPSLEGPLFRAGAEAAAREPIAGEDTFGGLFVAYHQEVNQGRCLVTEADRERWSITPERLQKAALSIALHRGSEHTPRGESDTSEILRFATGDGSDAARALLLEAIFFGPSRRGLAFGVPTPDTLLVEEVSPAGPSDALREAVARSYREASAPLSSSVYTYRNGAISGPI